MARSPLFYPLHRGADADGGGVADLQTDVMRFMAILALCLVAIFALVQSIPLAPEEPQSPPARPDKVSAPPPPVSAPQGAEPTPAPQTAPAPVQEPLTPKRSTEALTETAVEPPTTAPEATTPPDEPRFKLRFESDLALTRLVARDEVGLYAMTPEKSLRMNVNRGEISFWVASVPNQFHEMDVATVPDRVVTALRRAGIVEYRDAVKWGVTLPARMREQLDRYLREELGGTLIIGPDGVLRLER